MCKLSHFRRNPLGYPDDFIIIDGLQVFLHILTLSIIGLDDISVVTKVSKTSIKVFGPEEFISWVFRTKKMLLTGKTAKIPANSSA